MEDDYDQEDELCQTIELDPDLFDDKNPQLQQLIEDDGPGAENVLLNNWNLSIPKQLS